MLHLQTGVNNIYTNFAYVYDKLMYDIDYEKWADYIEKIFKSNKLEPELVLDLGCGTGSLCIEMAKRGYDMTGIDISADMLSCAKTKSESAGFDNILYLNQDMTNFELYGTVDAILCLMDSVNYITHKNDIKKLFKLVKNYLNPGGLFIFDINTCYKLEKVLGDNMFYDVGDDITYIWENHYDKKRKVCTFDLTFFIRRDEDYKRYDETHYERVYSVGEIKGMADQSGLELLGLYNEMSFSSPGKSSERIFFVYKK
jgi:ubiquinone/menaquinone biosynthesis C-methylase UbiE